MKSIEPEITTIANNWLQSYGLDYKQEQGELNSSIDKALKDYESKGGGKGGNRPDAKLINIDKNQKQYPILIEYKGQKDKLEKLDEDLKIDNTNVKGEANFKNISGYVLSPNTYNSHVFYGG